MRNLASKSIPLRASLWRRSEWKEQKWSTEELNLRPWLYRSKAIPLRHSSLLCRARFFSLYIRHPCVYVIRSHTDFPTPETLTMSYRYRTLWELRGLSTFVRGRKGEDGGRWSWKIGYSGAGIGWKERTREEIEKVKVEKSEKVGCWLWVGSEGRGARG